MFGEADESIFLYDDQGKKVGFRLLTMNYAPRKMPGLLGTYVLPQERKKGYGKQLVEAGLNRLNELGAGKIAIEIETDEGEATFNSLSENIRHACEVFDVRPES